MAKPIIEDIVIIGDSLSDRGEMECRKLFGFIPMDYLSGLSGKSPQGRFSDGLTWSDQLGCTFGVMSRFEEICLEDPTAIKTNSGETIVRTYCEGGATAHDYSSRITANPVTMATQQILANLDELRGRLFNNDIVVGTTIEQKKKTLVIEWSGANDLITINTDYDLTNTEYAVAARIRNTEEMISNGYRNFFLFKLPDLSLTPRFQKKTTTDQKSIQGVCNRFNERLVEEIEKLKIKYPDCSLNVYDANKLFSKAYNNPKDFGFHKDKLIKAFTDSNDFSAGCPSEKARPYMFWDDVHPTAEVGRILSADFYMTAQQTFKLFAPKERLVQIFKEQYGLKLDSERDGCCGFFKNSRINYTDINLTIDQIVEHALRKKGSRSREVMIELGWIDKKNNLLIENEALAKAIRKLDKNYYEPIEIHTV